jgi:predicted enzyme related to lactoylglutathione lyase
MQVTDTKYMLLAPEMKRAVAFWRDVIGFEVSVASEHWSELCGPNAVIALHLGHDGSDNPSGISLEVADIQEAAASIEAAGGRIVEAPHEGNPPGLWLADVADSEGNLFMLSQDSRAE